MNESCTSTGRCAHFDAANEGAENVDRRSFLVQGAVSAAMLALAACSLDATAPDPGPAVGSSIKVSDYAELSATGGVLLAGLSGTPVAIIRTSATSFLVLSRVCPHQGVTIGRNGSGFRCPAHGAQYDGSGRWQSGERTSNMRSYATSYDAATDTLTIG